MSLTEYRGFPSSSKTRHLLLIPQQEQATCQTSPLSLSLSPVTGGKQAELFSVQGARDFENLKKKKKGNQGGKKKERER